MKRIAVAILLLASYCHAQTADGFQPASTNVWGADYPRVDASGRAEFRIKAPSAAAVKPPVERMSPAPSHETRVEVTSVVSGALLMVPARSKRPPPGQAAVRPC